MIGFFRDLFKGINSSDGICYVYDNLVYTNTNSNVGYWTFI